MSAGMDPEDEELLMWTSSYIPIRGGGGGNEKLKIHIVLADGESGWRLIR
jgi:hypothetical protein